MRTFAVGDIHGAAKALDQVLERSGFDSSSDRLIVLGDVVDGWPETKQVVDRLLEIPDRVSLIGNHDLWFLEALSGSSPGMVWVSQGGRATLDSYGIDSYWGVVKPDEVSDSHREYFRSCLSFIADSDRNHLYVHGGIDPHRPLPSQTATELCWNRDMWQRAMTRQEPVGDWDTIFIGHTSIGAAGPVKAGNVWNLDTGAGWEGVLTIMDVDTEEYWQSDRVADLYPEHRGRR